MEKHNIKDAVTEQTSLDDYLECLPGLTRRVSYSGPESNNTGDEPLVLNRTGTEVGTWHEAVTGIAFGGMVPLATLPLVQAVRFTAGGGQGLGDAVYQLDKLMALEAFQIQGDPELRGLNLFRPYKERDLQHMSSSDLPEKIIWFEARLVLPGIVACDWLSETLIYFRQTACSYSKCSQDLAHNQKVIEAQTDLPGG